MSFKKLNKGEGHSESVVGAPSAMAEDCWKRLSKEPKRSLFVRLKRGRRNNPLGFLNRKEYAFREWFIPESREISTLINFYYLATAINFLENHFKTLTKVKIYTPKEFCFRLAD